MEVKRLKGNQIAIKFSSNIDAFGLQKIIDYIKYLEATSKSKASQSDADKLAEEINSSWWKKTKPALDSENNC